MCFLVFFLELFNLTYINLPENLFSHTDFQGTSAYTHFEGVIHRLYAFFEKHQKQTFYILLQKY